MYNDHFSICFCRHKNYIFFSFLSKILKIKSSRSIVYRISRKTVGFLIQIAEQILSQDVIIFSSFKCLSEKCNVVLLYRITITHELKGYFIFLQSYTIICYTIQRHNFAPHFRPLHVTSIILFPKYQSAVLQNTAGTVRISIFLNECNVDVLYSLRIVQAITDSLGFKARRRLTLFGLCHSGLVPPAVRTKLTTTITITRILYLIEYI